MLTRARIERIVAAVALQRRLDVDVSLTPQRVTVTARHGNLHRASLELDPHVIVNARTFRRYLDELFDGFDNAPTS